MATTKQAKRGKSVHDVFSMGPNKAREVTAADRITVLEAVLAGADHRKPVAWMDRWTVERISTLHGWPRVDLMQTNLANLRESQ